MNRTWLLIFLVIFACSNPESSPEKSHQNVQDERFKAQLAQKDKELALQKEELEILKNKLEKDDEIPLSALYKQVKSSVFTIYTSNEIGIAQGTAFTISSDGLALSNYHVFEKASEAIAINEYDQKFMITEIIDFDQELDYVLFRLGATSQMPYVPIASQGANIGDECFTVGNPKGLTQTLSNGIISSYRQQSQLLQITSEITNGSSGGPLFNKRGEVIGITSGGLGEANLNFAVNIASIPLGSYLLENRHSENNGNGLANNKAKNSRDLILSYYEVLFNKEWHLLEAKYAQEMKRYFSEFNINRHEAIKASQVYYEKFEVKSVDFDIRWDSFKVTPLKQGTKVEFLMDYSIERQDKSKPSSFLLEMIIEFNDDGKIYSIYENILRKV